MAPKGNSSPSQTAGPNDGRRAILGRADQGLKVPMGRDNLGSSVHGGIDTTAGTSCLPKTTQSIDYDNKYSFIHPSGYLY